MFVSIACGATSGFHATQSPLMARCMKSEMYGRPVFYGAMITEGIVALIWAAAATCFFGENGMEGMPYKRTKIEKEKKRELEKLVLRTISPIVTGKQIGRAHV